MRPLYVRKAIHAALAVGVAGGAAVGGVPLMIFVGSALGLLFVLVRKYDVCAPFRLVSRTSYGELYFALGIILVGLLTLPDDVLRLSLSLLVMGIADPLAAVVGTFAGRHRYLVFGEQRTIEGSITCFVVAGVILTYGGMSVGVAALGGVLLAAIEALAPKGSDNVLLPVAAALLLGYL